MNKILTLCPIYWAIVIQGKKEIKILFDDEKNYLCKEYAEDKAIKINQDKKWYDYDIKGKYNFNDIE